jgi:hypothetical protein
MSVRKAKSHGRAVWQARVFYHDRRRSEYCATKGQAGDDERRDFRTLRAALKLGRPEYRFPGTAGRRHARAGLRPEEELLVLEPMPSPFREIAKLAALTLMRQGELRTLRPEYMRLEQGVVLLPRAKGGARSADRLPWRQR